MSITITVKMLNYSDGPCLRKGIALVDGSPDLFKGNDVEFQAAKKKLLNNLTDALTKRFPETDVGIVKATSILNFSSWPGKDASNGVTFKMISSCSFVGFVDFVDFVALLFCCFVHN